VQFEAMEGFFRDHIVDYNIDALFAPLDLSDKHRIELKGGAADLVSVGVPAMDKTLLEKQMKIIRARAVERDERLEEIVLQQADTLSFFGAMVFLDEVRTPWTLTLLDAILRLGTYLEMPIKHSIAAPRPIDYNPKVQPIVPTPTHGSMPSGHAVEAFAVAAFLDGLCNTQKPWEMYDATSALTGDPHMFMRLAARISENRTVAGLHFPRDNFAGAVMGLSIGEYLVNALSGAPCTGKYVCDLSKFDGSDFGIMEMVNAVEGGPPLVVREEKTIDGPAPHPILKELWCRARAELRGINV